MFAFFLHQFCFDQKIYSLFTIIILHQHFLYQNSCFYTKTFDFFVKNSVTIAKNWCKKFGRKKVDPMLYISILCEL